MEDLTSKQEQVLKFLIDVNAKYGFPPTIRELCHHFGLIGTCFFEGRRIAGRP